MQQPQFSPIYLAVPFALQQKEGQCLAACAAMTLAYLNVPFSYRRLLNLLEIQEFGASFFNLQHLEALGVRVSLSRRGTLIDLYKHLCNGHPCIVSVMTHELPYWNGEAVLHALVVIGIDPLYIYLNDPEFADSPMKASHGNFELAWLERDEAYAVLTR